MCGAAGCMVLLLVVPPAEGGVRQGSAGPGAERSKGSVREQLTLLWPLKGYTAIQLNYFRSAALLLSAQPKPLNPEPAWRHPHVSI